MLSDLKPRVVLIGPGVQSRLCLDRRGHGAHRPASELRAALAPALPRRRWLDLDGHTGNSTECRLNAIAIMPSRMAGVLTPAW